MMESRDVAPAIIPVSYLSFFDMFSDPIKLIGFIVLLLQGIYVCIKIYKEMKGKNVAPDTP